MTLTSADRSKFELLGKVHCISTHSKDLVLLLFRNKANFIIRKMGKSQEKLTSIELQKCIQWEQENVNAKNLVSIVYDFGVSIWQTTIFYSVPYS